VKWIEETFSVALQELGGDIGIEEYETEESGEYEEAEFESFPDFIATRQEAP